MKHFIKQNTWLIHPLIHVGWGNGYVIIPEGHPLHGKHYDDIDVNIHGGLTFGVAANELDWPEIAEEDKNGWVVGFDTAHYMDNAENWTKKPLKQKQSTLKNNLRHSLNNTSIMQSGGFYRRGFFFFRFRHLSIVLIPR